MKAVIQRVMSANVKIGDNIVGSIEKGFVVLLGVAEGDGDEQADYLASKIAGLRVFTDDNDKMNMSITDINGKMLVISNFTLCADCRKGRRPAFVNAARPDEAERLYERFKKKLMEHGIELESGEFGADMKVSLVNDGPVTIIMDTDEMMK